MATVYDGHGITITFNGAALKAVSIGLGGRTRQVYETTLLANALWKTKRAGALIEAGDITATVEYDPPAVNALMAAVGGTSYTCVISKPTVFTATFYAEVTEVGEVTFEEDGRATVDITITPTNWNGSSETAPVFT